MEKMVKMKNLKIIIGMAAIVGLLGAGLATAGVLVTNTATVDSAAMGLDTSGAGGATMIHGFTQSQDTEAGDGLGYRPTGGLGAKTNNPVGCVLTGTDDGGLHNPGAGTPNSCGYFSSSPQTATGSAAHTATGTIEVTTPFSILVGVAGAGDGFLSISGTNSFRMIANTTTGVIDTVDIMTNNFTQDMDLYTTGIGTGTGAGDQLVVMNSGLQGGQSFQAEVSQSEVGGLGTSRPFDFSMDLIQQVESDYYSGSPDPDGFYGPQDIFANTMLAVGGNAGLPPVQNMPPGWQ